MRQVVQQTFGDEVPVRVAVSRAIAGKADDHQFDVALLNGQPLGVLVTPNFQNPRLAEVKRDLEAAAWSILDVRQRDDQVGVGVVVEGAIAPRLQKSVDVLTGLDVELLEGPHGWNSWAVELTRRVADPLPEAPRPMTLTEDGDVRSSGA